MLTGAAILLCLAVAALFALRGVPKVIPEHDLDESAETEAEPSRVG
ncbi:hypothetical protein [Sphaerimonospora thailandensis]|uniref:Uncharacterized protein n=1 Tax=Sphaerimonospora thailandensis TaxID=795644 RepID=A0A8J3VXP9_9ACTN|nr:hypothetical protein [Sphaerimonospora thailandensis]GIH68717.1 hypothetical protein Mth01_09700 [Sphaerimonospora thailandensis]